MSKWHIRFANDRAADEAALLFEDQEIKAECLRLLKLLAEEDSPGKPQNSALKVSHLEHDASNWYRLRVDKYKIRIAFSLLYISSGRAVEYQFGEAILDDAENYVGIQYTGYRAADTYVEIRRRWRKSRRK